MKEYGTSAVKWKSHTSTMEFAAEFRAILTAYEDDNDLRSAKLEEFLLAEATRAGVLAVSSKRTAKNPNKWAKHLALWYYA